VLRGAWWLLRPRRHLVQPARRARLDVAWHQGGGPLPTGLRLIVETGSAETGCQGCGGGRRSPRPTISAAPRHPGVQGAGRAGVAATSLPLQRAGVPNPRFSEIHALAPPRAKLTRRAPSWAISCIQRDNASRVGSQPARGWTGKPSGMRFVRCCPGLPMIPLGWPRSRFSASTSTSCAVRRCCFGWR
jgi:hypothetical protein